MNPNNDIFYEELLNLKNFFKKQPDKNVKAAKIVPPYKTFFIQTYQIYSSHLKKYKLHKARGIIESIFYNEKDPISGVLQN